MTCYSPLTMYWTGEYTDLFHKKRKYTFKPTSGYYDEFVVKVPCGQCIGCRLERSRQWAVRCMHEASLHEKNCFITLTYAPEHLPPNSSLVKDDLTKFWKRLRDRLGYPTLRYYACGEYGELHGRPHYHACVFGYDFPDKKVLKVQNGFVLYDSDLLKDIWGKGRVAIGEVTFESAGYVARYILKKALGKKAEDMYAALGIVPEYTVMSRRPGIASGWIEKYADVVLRNDSVIVRGHECKPPKFYDKIFDLDYPEYYNNVIKPARKLKALSLPEKNPHVSHRCKQIACKKLIRPLESDYIV